MVNNNHSDISAATLIHGVPMVKWLKPASTYLPGTWIYQSAAVTATAIDVSTAVCNLSKPFLLEFKPRVTSAWARKDVDDTYATTDEVPCILGGRKGHIITVAAITDPAATVYPGHCWEPSTTAGEIIAMIAHNTSGAGTIRWKFNGFNTDTLVSGDDFMKFAWV